MLNSILNVIYRSILGEILLIFCITLVTVYILRKILSYLQNKSKNDWVRSFCKALFIPSKWLVFGYGLFSILDVLLRDTQYTERVLQVRYVFVVSFLVWIFFRWKSSFEKILIRKILKNSQNKKNDQIIISAVSKLVAIGVVAFFILMVLDVLGVPLSGLLAFGGVSGIAVSWAAKDIVANFFGGFMIYVNRPFVIGDWIHSPNKDFEGTVEDIGWYMTHITTFEQRPLYIPNALITDAIIENPGRMNSRRIKEIIGLRYDDLKHVKNILSDIESMLKNHPDIDESNVLRVLLERFSDYSIDICVYAFSKEIGGTGYRKVKQDVLLKIADIVEKHGAEIAFPTQIIQLKK